MMTRLPSIFLVIVVVVKLLVLPCSLAYITSHGAVPRHRQQAWLSQLTKDFCSVRVGELSHHQLSQAPHLWQAWTSHHNTHLTKESVIQTEGLLKRWIDEQRAGNPNAVPLSAEDYNCVVEAWARLSYQVGVPAAERCQAIVEGMIVHGPFPNLDSFKAVLMAWRQVQDKDHAPRRAQDMLERMIHLSKQRNDATILPDADCFDSVLQTWSRSGHADAPQRAEYVLGVMERLYEITELSQPRTTSFNAVLAAWAKSSSPLAASRTWNILAFMERLQRQDENCACAPDAVSYAIVVGTVTKSSQRAKAARQVDALVRRVLARDPILVTTLLLNMAMGCWAKSCVSGSFHRARRLLQVQQDNSHCAPDVVGYTSVIAAAANEGQDTEAAWKVASSTYQALQESSTVQSNQVTYVTMLKACTLPSSVQVRNAWSKRVFQDACRDGVVNAAVVQRLKQAAAPKVFHSLMQGHTLKTLPKAWTKHASDGERKKPYPNILRKRAEV